MKTAILALVITLGMVGAAQAQDRPVMPKPKMSFEKGGDSARPTVRVDKKYLKPGCVHKSKPASNERPGKAVCLD